MTLLSCYIELSFNNIANQYIAQLKQETVTRLWYTGSSTMYHLMQNDKQITSSLGFSNLLKPALSFNNLIKIAIIINISNIKVPEYFWIIVFNSGT